MIKSRRVRLAGHVARMGEIRNAYSFGQRTWREGNFDDVVKKRGS
jgi:hypothetical protein